VIKIPKAVCAFMMVVAAGMAAVPRAAAQDCRPARRAELAVTPMGNVPIVTLRVNGGLANFLFDTGAERTILNVAAAKRLGVEPHYEYARRMHSLGSAVAGGDAQLRSLDLGGIVLAGFRILVGPVSLPMVAGKPIDGLLGEDFLSGFEVDLDLGQRRVILYQPPPCAITAPAWPEPYTTIKANRSLHDRLFFPVSLDGHRLAALIDTGAQLTVLDSDSAVALGVTGAGLSRDPVANLRGAAAEIVRSHAHRFARLEIDGEVLRDPVVVIAAMGLQDADLVLGADFLHWQRAWLSYTSQQVFLQRHR
jgi:predicted aspartyl protease